MTLLICGLGLFLGIHSVSILADRWRNEQVAKLGVRTWKVLYSLISIAGLALMTLGYLEARPQPITVWTPPGGGNTNTTIASNQFPTTQGKLEGAIV